MPARKVSPSRGWRLVLYKATFGLVNLGPSADEIRQVELESKIKSVLRGHYKVGVMGKGGVGKTTVSASVGSVFAAAEWAHQAGLAGRRFFLYDTFTGFPVGTPAETDAFGNVVPMYSHPNFLAVARAAVARSSWPADGFVFVEGPGSG